MLYITVFGCVKLRVEIKISVIFKKNSDETCMLMNKNKIRIDNLIPLVTSKWSHKLAFLDISVLQMKVTQLQTQHYDSVNACFFTTPVGA